MIGLSADEVLHIYTDILYENFENESLTQILAGNYKKRILVIIKSTEYDVGDEALLSKMLQACQLAQDDYYLIAATSADMIRPLITKHNPETIILFGMSLDTDMMKLQKPKYKPFRFNQIKILLCDSLPAIAKDGNLKIAMWTQGLKPLFKIP